MPEDSDAPRPSRPRRERPLVAPGREAKTPPIWEQLPPPSGTPLGAPTSLLTPTDRPDHVVVAFQAPADQRRVTVAFRIFIAIPHIAWWYLLNIAMQVLTFISWFGALFTGRVPKDMHDFNTRALQYETRLYAYLLLLTDKQPPWPLGSDDHPVAIETHGTELNRAAVFFRLVLGVPTYVITTLLSVGLMVVAPVGWILTLVLGRLPEPLFGANAAALRYMTRSRAYMSLLTAEYPAGLRSDPPASIGAAALPGDTPDVPVDLPTSPRFTRLVLGKGARFLVGLYLGLGALLYVGMGIGVGVVLATSLDDIVNLSDAHVRLDDAVDDFAAASQTCTLSAGQAQLDCLHAADLALAAEYDRFASDIADLEFPFEAEDIEGEVALARDCSAALREMALTTTAADYNAALEDYRDAASDLDELYYGSTSE